MSSRKGFTLIEIIAVTVVVGVIAIFVVPNVVNSVTQTTIQAHENNLRSIAAAQQKYNEDHGNYYSSPNGGPANDFYGINSNLSLTMQYENNGFNYQCAGLGSTYTCTASNGNYPWTPGTTACVDVNGNVAITPGASKPNGQSCTACGGLFPCGVVGSCTAIPGGDCNCSEQVTDLCGTCGGTCTAANGDSSCPSGVCVPIINGNCGASNDLCTAGTPAGDTGNGTSTAYRWTCDGSGGGSNASCGPVCNTGYTVSGNLCVVSCTCTGDGGVAGSCGCCNNDADSCNYCGGTANCTGGETCEGDACYCLDTTDTTCTQYLCAPIWGTACGSQSFATSWHDCNGHEFYATCPAPGCTPGATTGCPY